jgi:radical SAM superfamily enzyme YgiQ (UPF0313 family)
MGTVESWNGGILEGWNDGNPFQYSNLPLFQAVLLGAVDPGCYCRDVINRDKPYLILMRVLLISANPLTAPYPVYPLGLDYVAKAVSGRHQVKILDINAVGDFEEIQRTIDEFAPEVVGFSLRNIDNTDTTDPRGFIGIYRDLVDAVRDRTSAPIVLGGSGFTIFPVEMMQALSADYGIIGEGERLARLLDALSEGADVSNLPGVVTAESEACMPEPWEHSYDRLVNGNNAHLQYYLAHGGMLNLQSKRGCPFHCIYCTYPHIEGRKMRRIPPEEVARTARALQDAGAKYLFVTDSAFNADYEHSRAVAQAFIRQGLSIPWGGFFAPTVPPPGYFKQMAESGLTHVEFGTEALCDRMLAAYRKPFRVAQVFQAHQDAIDAGLYVAHYFLLGGPGESRHTLSETLINVDKLAKTVLFFFCGIRIYPHTALYDHAVETGQISPTQNLLEPVFYQSEFISSQDILNQVKQHAGSRLNWIIGAGGDETAGIVSRLYARGHVGPLWEYLIQ